MAVVGHLEFLKCCNLFADGIRKAKMHHPVKSRFFQDSGGPPSCICFGGTCVPPTVSIWYITVQNLVIINAVFSIIIYERFNSCRVWLENAYSRPKIEVLELFGPLNGLQYQLKPKTAYLHGCVSFEPSSVKIWPVV